jgi:hypothetical protein
MAQLMEAPNGIILSKQHWSWNLMPISKSLGATGMSRNADLMSDFGTSELVPRA